MAQPAPPNAPMLLSVAEARAARERARTGAAEKGQEAHRWLGERYRRLLESADAIGDLGVAARDATAFATAVEAKARDATAASQATPALPPPPAKITSPDAAAAKATMAAVAQRLRMDARRSRGRPEIAPTARQDNLQDRAAQAQPTAQPSIEFSGNKC